VKNHATPRRSAAKTVTNPDRRLYRLFLALKIKDKGQPMGDGRGNDFALIFTLQFLL